MKPYYQADGITIYHGDCRELAAAWAPVADLIVTDPPYGIGWSRGDDPGRYSKAHPGILGDEDTSARDEALALVPNVPAIVFGSFYAPAPARTKQLLVWHKPEDSGVVGSVTGYRRDAEPIYLLDPWPVSKVRWSSVVRSSRHSIKSVTVETGHPHTKPVDLVRTLIGRAPHNGGVVVDPFMGTGATLRAAKDLGLRAIGVELDASYCEVAARRMGQGVLNFGGAT